MTAVDVHAVVTGPVGAPVALLSNSLGSTHRMWDAQLPELAERFRVVERWFTSAFRIACRRTEW
jgi:3-oxoadipate enol-lactonase